MENPTKICKTEICVRPLRSGDLDEADRVMRLAFGTFVGMDDPSTFMGDAGYIRTRWKANPAAAYGAECEDQIIGSNIANDWGSVGFFGPLTVRPDFWDQGVGKLLMEPIMDQFTKWQTKHIGLFTFAQSPKHLSLYMKFGFWPRFLTASMSKSVDSWIQAPRWTRFSDVPECEQAACLSACRDLTEAVFPGLDLCREIQSVLIQKLGDTVLLWGDRNLDGLGVCHSGPGTEAGSGACYIKFGAVRPGAAAEENFTALLGGCENLAVQHGATRLNAGVNTARQAAYNAMAHYGFKTNFQGVAMQRPNEPGYNRPETFLIDDWM